MNNIIGGIKMEMKVYGIFTKRKGFIYRTKTYLQFGESDKIIGSCVLCNPGSSVPKDPIEKEELLNYTGDNDYVFKGELVPDTTMKQLCKILENVGWDKLGINENGGRFLIHNIFTLRNGNMNHAIKEFENQDIDKELLFKDYKDYMELEESIPWTLKGWGCEDKVVIRNKKRKWLRLLNEKEALAIGYKHKDDPHYYHPAPHLKGQKEECLEVLTRKIKAIL